MTAGVVRKQRQKHAGTPMTGTMEPFYVDNGTPAPSDGIRFSVVHATSEDRAKAD